MRMADFFKSFEFGGDEIAHVGSLDNLDGEAVVMFVLGELDLAADS